MGPNTIRADSDCFHYHCTVKSVLIHRCVSRAGRADAQPVREAGRRQLALVARGWRGAAIASRKNCASYEKQGHIEISPADLRGSRSPIGDRCTPAETSGNLDCAKPNMPPLVEGGPIGRSWRTMGRGARQPFRVNLFDSVALCACAFRDEGRVLHR